MRVHSSLLRAGPLTRNTIKGNNEELRKRHLDYFLVKGRETGVRLVKGVEPESGVADCRDYSTHHL